MKISQYLRNLMSNFPVGHDSSSKAMRYLSQTLAAEERCDHSTLYQIAEEFGLDPILFNVDCSEE